MASDFRLARRETSIAAKYEPLERTDRGLGSSNSDCHNDALRTIADTSSQCFSGYHNRYVVYPRYADSSRFRLAFNLILSRPISRQACLGKHATVSLCGSLRGW